MKRKECYVNTNGPFARFNSRSTVTAF